MLGICYIRYKCLEIVVHYARRVEELIVMYDWQRQLLLLLLYINFNQNYHCRRRFYHSSNSTLLNRRLYILYVNILYDKLMHFRNIVKLYINIDRKILAQRVYRSSSLYKCKDWKIRNHLSSQCQTTWQWYRFDPLSDYRSL